MRDSCLSECLSNNFPDFACLLLFGQFSSWLVTRQNNDILHRDRIHYGTKKWGFLDKLSKSEESYPNRPAREDNLSEIEISYLCKINLSQFIYKGNAFG